MEFKLIFDIYHGNVELSNFESYLLKSPVINRLHQILQNSTAYLVFPSCKTARFEHSIGVLNYTSLMFNNGLKNSSVQTEYIEEKCNLFGNILEENNSRIFESVKGNGGMEQDKYKNILFKKYKVTSYSKLLQEKEFLNELITLIGPVFRERNLDISRFVGRNDLVFTQIVLFQSVRVFGLLHDIGHLPFSHLFEFSIDSLFDDLIQKQKDEGLNDFENEVLDSLNKLMSKDAGEYQSNQIHEIIGKNITKHIFNEIKDTIYQNKELKDIDKARSIFVIYCLELIWEELMKGRKSRLFSLYSIVSGIIDSDRLDYIQRDGAASGVNKCTGNIDRIIKLFCLSRTNESNGDFSPNDNYIFMPSIQSLHDVEKILNDRFNIYKYMVNHHAVKRSDYIFQNGIEHEFKHELKLETKFSEGIRVEKLIDSIKIADELVNSTDTSVFNRFIYRFTQISDFWLLSLFTTKYFEVIHNSEEDPMYKNLLGEIFENRRNFKSLWKRVYDYNEFILELEEDFFKSDIQFKEIEEKNIDPATYYTILKIIKRHNKGEKKPNILGSILLDLLKGQYGNQWCKKIEKIAIKNDQNHLYLIVPTKLSTGIKSNEKLWLIDNKDQNKIYDFDKVSRLKKSLENDSKGAIMFFTYICSKDIKTEVNFAEVKDNLVSSINELILTTLKNLNVCAENIKLQSKQSMNE